MLRRFLSVVVLMASALGIVAACAKSNAIDPCKRALTRLEEECGYEVSGLEQVEIHCSGEQACVAVCMETVACDELFETSGEYADCTAGCE